MRLIVASRWDGQPLAEEEHVFLELHAKVGALQVCIDAPGPVDPSPPGQIGACWGLWEHEVVELFVAGSDGRYTEIEMGPFGHHLVLRLDGVRQVIQQELPLDYKVTQAAGRWKGMGLLDACWLPPPPHRINAYAIRGRGKHRCYMAWQAVPGEEPDFHQPDCFVPVGDLLSMD